MTSSWIGLAAAGVCLLTATACANGFVYRRTVQPLTTDFDRTPVVGCAPGRDDLKQLRYRYLDFRWEGNGIGRIASDAGFDTIYYADVETLSILGVWTQRWVLVYGDRGGACQPTPS